MNVAVIGFSDEARTIIHSLEQKLVDDVFIKYVLTDYKDLNNPIYNSIKQKVISNFAKIIDDLSIGDKVLVNNGLLIFEVESLEGNNAVCKVIAGGELSNRKSMNFPNKVMNHKF